MSKSSFTPTEWFYWIVRVVFGAFSTPPRIVANWATNRLNKSYYKKLPYYDEFGHTPPTRPQSGSKGASKK